MKNYLKKIGTYYSSLLKSKSIGFYLCSIVCLLMIIQTIVYSQIPNEIYSGTVTILSIVGILLFFLFSFSIKEVEILSPISLMILNFLCFTSYVAADGVLDYFSTAFFSGFSLGALFALPVGVWLPVILFILNFIISSVAMYTRQSKKEEKSIAIQGENNQ